MPKTHVPRASGISKKISGVKPRTPWEVKGWEPRRRTAGEGRCRHADAIDAFSSIFFYYTIHIHGVIKLSDD